MFKPISAWNHPLIAAAAVSAMVLGVLGVAEVTGVIRGIYQGSADAPQAASMREPVRAPQAPSKCPLCGTVESIRTVELRGEALDMAAADVAGASAAGQIGREGGTTTILGTAPEAAGGNEGEKNVKKRIAYRVTVRMDDGSYRTVSQSNPPALAVGDKVRVVEGRLVRA